MARRKTWDTPSGAHRPRGTKMKTGEKISTVQSRFVKKRPEAMNITLKTPPWEEGTNDDTSDD